MMLMKTKIIALFVGTVVRKASSEGLFADGGYQTQPVECVNQWTYKEKLTDTDNLETELQGCVSIEEFQPFPFFGNRDASEIANLLEPTSGDTDKTMWCPVLRDVYNPTPLRNPENKFNWGYCLDTSAQTEETDAPSASPTESEPTQSPSTQAPTEFPTEEYEPFRTENPTKSPVPAPVTEETDPPSSPPVQSPVAPPVPDTPANQGGDLVPVMDTGTLIGIGVAAVLVVVAIMMGVVLFHKMRRRKEEVEDEVVEQHDIEDNTNLTRN